MGLAAFGAAATLALAACGGGSSSSSTGGTATGFNAAVKSVVNPSNHKSSGTLNFASSAAIPDSTDPGNTYYAQM